MEIAAREEHRAASLAIGPADDGFFPQMRRRPADHGQHADAAGPEGPRCIMNAFGAVDAAPVRANVTISHMQPSFLFPAYYTIVDKDRTRTV